MTKTKVKGGKRVVVKLNPMTFKRMINDIIKKLYGTGSCGELKYCFHDAGLNYLKEAAESFLENMWEQLRGMSVYSENRNRGTGTLCLHRTPVSPVRA